MFIQTEKMPDTKTMRFLPGRTVLASGRMEFFDAEDSAKSPLAERLLIIDGVTSVELGVDYIAVTKVESAEWQLMKPMILGAIMEHLMAGHPVVLDDEETKDEEEENDDDEIVDQFYEGEDVFLEKGTIKLHPNEYVMLVSSSNEKKTALARFTSFSKPLRRISDFKSDT